MMKYIAYIEGVNIVAVDAKDRNSCEGCALVGKGMMYCDSVACLSDERPDLRDVVFKLMSEAELKTRQEAIVEEELKRQKSRGQPAIGEYTVFIDKFNGFYYFGVVTHHHPTSHYDSPVWVAETITCIKPNGEEVDMQGISLSLTHAEWKAGIERRFEDD